MSICLHVIMSKYNIKSDHMIIASLSATSSLTCPNMQDQHSVTARSQKRDQNGCD